MTGLAGTGKTTIARTVARWCNGKDRLAASFFFSRGGGDVGHAGKFVTTIAVQLARHVPAYRQHICNTIEQHKDIASQSLRDQWNHLVLHPLSKLDDSSPFVLVVDALDECDNNNDVEMIVGLLAEARSLVKPWLRVLLTSRPEVPIRCSFNQMPTARHRTFLLHDISSLTIDSDISIFLDHNLQRIGEEHCLGHGWPGRKIISQLVQSASGLFIWAATACRFIRAGRQSAEQRLKAVISSKGTTGTGPEEQLDEIYVTVLRSSINPGFTDKEREEHLVNLRYVLGSLVVLSAQLSVHSLNRLLNLKNVDIGQTLLDLHAILAIPKNQAQPLRLHHPTFRDFLLDKNRCTEIDFCIDKKQAHQRLAEDCIQLMSACLKRDICHVGAVDTLAADVQHHHIEQCIPLELQYACIYWVQHLNQSGTHLHDNNEVHLFLKAHLLHWLEALGWIGMVTAKIDALAALEVATGVSL